MNHSGARKIPVVAIDARLVGRNATGDSTYWTGLLYGFVRAFADSERPVHLILYSNQPAPNGLPEGKGIEWRVIPGNARWWSLVTFPLAARKAGASVIHTQYSLSPLVGQIGMTTVHDVSFFIGPEWFPARDRFILQRSVPAACRRAARVVTVSETSQHEIERYIPEARGKCVLTPNACPPWIVRQDRELAMERVAGRFGIRTPYLLTVGTRWPRKNFALAAAAAEGLSSDLPHSLVVTGKSGWGDQSAGKRGQAVGFVDTETLSDLYSAADLYLLPSRHEGFGIPALEAFRCGCPVIGSNGGAVPEVIGTAGEIVPEWDPADWSRRIESVLRNPSKLHAMQQAGFERERSFSWEATAKGLADVYREVAGC